jgi:hypothetical protein
VWKAQLRFLGSSSMGMSGVAGVSHRPTRRRKGVTQRASSLQEQRFR